MQYPPEIHNTLLKPMFFSQLTLLSNNLVLTSYLSGIYLDSWLSWLWGGRSTENIKKKKQTEEKHYKVERKKNEEYEKVK